jgi:hypothetical protein
MKKMSKKMAKAERPWTPRKTNLDMPAHLLLLSICSRVGQITNAPSPRRRVPSLKCANVLGFGLSYLHPAFAIAPSSDLDFIDDLIQVRRAYVDQRFGLSDVEGIEVPMHPLLAAHLLAWRKETLYSGDEDFVFPSLRLKGPPAANMLVADH